MGRKRDQGDITNRICLSVTVYIFMLFFSALADIFLGWAGPFIVVIPFCAWLIILTEKRKKAGTFNGSLLLF